eukprot:2514449-Prymnesium_polylepis.1
MSAQIVSPTALSTAFLSMSLKSSSVLALRSVPGAELIVAGTHWSFAANAFESSVNGDDMSTRSAREKQPRMSTGASDRP